MGVKGALCCALTLLATTSLGKAQGQIIDFTITDAPAVTSFSQLATAVLGGQPGAFFGTVPSSSVEQACKQLVSTGLHTLSAKVSAYGVTDMRTLQVTAIGGCDASPASPAGVQAALLDTTAGQTFGVLCGNFVNGGLDPTTPVDSCNVYLTGPAITAEYNSLKAANATTRSTRRLQQNSNNGCRACVSNCVCGNSPASGSGNGNCFPGAAMVTVEGRGAIPMKAIEAGDKVLSINKYGKAFYDPVHFFGHKDSDKWGSFLDITVQTPATNATNHLTLTQTHFLPVGTVQSGGTFVYARDVAVGDTLWVQPSALEQHPVAATVISKTPIFAQGLFNPYTSGGFIVVEGVVASAHSFWLLDHVMPRALIKHLPSIYQILFQPIFLAGRLCGISAVSALLEALVPFMRDEHVALLKASSS